jgi:hypothetical protein
MSLLQNLSHIIQLDKIPLIDDTTSFSETYKQLANAKMSGYILRSGQQYRAYVKGFDFAREVIAYGQLENQNLKQLVMKSISQLLEIPGLRNDLGSTLISIESDMKKVDTDLSVLQQQPDRVFQLEQGGKQIGWVLNHETLMITLTPRTVFYCKNPTQSHPNYDPDGGTCYKCPFELKEAKLEGQP